MESEGDVMSLDMTPVHRNLHTKVTFLGLEFEDLILVLALAALMNLLAHFVNGSAHVFLIWMARLSPERSRPTPAQEGHLAHQLRLPCAAIQDNSCGSVRRTMVHRIHFPVRPFTWKLIPPSCRRLTPAAASVQNAAGTARSSSNWRRSRRNCGVCIALRLYY
jgi:hypothetical protein